MGSRCNLTWLYRWEYRHEPFGSQTVGEEREAGLTCKAVVWRIYDLIFNTYNAPPVSPLIGIAIIVDNLDQKWFFWNAFLRREFQFNCNSSYWQPIVSERFKGFSSSRIRRQRFRFTQLIKPSEVHSPANMLWNELQAGFYNDPYNTTCINGHFSYMCIDICWLFVYP